MKFLNLPKYFHRMNDLMEHIFFEKFKKHASRLLDTRIFNLLHPSESDKQARSYGYEINIFLKIIIYFTQGLLESFAL